MLYCQRCSPSTLQRLVILPVPKSIRHLTSSAQHQYGHVAQDRAVQEGNKSTPKEGQTSRLSNIGYSPIQAASRFHDGADPKTPRTTAQSRQEWLESRGSRPLQKQKATARVPQFQPLTANAMKKNLQYLQDPVKLADSVKSLLQQDKLAEAQELIEAASRKALVTVSWNHLINYLLRQEKVNAAIKVFNDMKKRAQTPDAHTYTIIFRGLADMYESSQSNQSRLEKALSIYQSMLAANSPVKPSIIHTNAVMKVCGRAGDIDAMMGIAAQLQEKGLRAPNNMTYTTIFNAMRSNIQAEKDPELAQNLRKKLTNDARRIWFDVVMRWRKDMRIDEELVCSLGRLLLMGDAKDVDDIFSLLQQTMNIPRQHPALGTKSRTKMDPSQQGRKAQVDLPQTPETDEVTLSTDSEEEGDLSPVQQWNGTLEINLTNEQVTNKRGELVRPGQNSLSLVAEALLQLRMKDSMVRYWKIFTDELSIAPDSPNYHAYLRVLKTARASAEAVQVILAMPRRMVEYKTIRTAMSTCGRDKINPSSFKHAGQILDLMQSCLAKPDIGVLHTYLEVCIGGRETVREACREDNTKYAHGQRILRGLTRLDSHIDNLRSALAFSKPPGVTQPAHQKAYVDETKTRLIEVMAEMVSAYDQLLNNAMIPRETYSEIMKRRSTIAAYITRTSDKKKEMRRTRTGQVIDEEAMEKSTSQKHAFESRKLPLYDSRLSSSQKEGRIRDHNKFDRQRNIEQHEEAIARNAKTWQL